MNDLQIPSGWHKQTLGRIASIRIGKTPPRDHDEFWDVHKQSQNVWLSIRDMTNRYLSDSAEYITDKAIREFNIPAVEKDTILLSFKLTIGKVAIAQRELRTNEAIAAIKILDGDQTDNGFLSYGLSHWNLLQNVDQAIKGATLNKKKLREIEFTLPIDPYEQRAIADILSTVDEAIAQSESLVRKYQSIKQGLMSDLLTRGADENGELRDPEIYPNKFKASGFGLFPKRWEITTLGRIVSQSRGIIQTGPFGTQLHAHDYVKDGIPTMMPQYIDETGWINFEELPHLTQQKASELKRHILKVNDVIFARRGELSKCSAIDEREDGWVCGTDFMLVRVLPNVLNGKWFAHYYRNDICQRQVLAQAVGSTMKGINTVLLSSLIVALPNIEEQERIVAIIEAQEKLIKEEKAYRGKLLSLKQGLMQDLLSGQVRVKV